jgi:hypothetical protein
MKICSIEGCGKKHWAKGFCYNHYRKDWYENHPITKSCSIEGCEKKHWGRGLCKSHFSKYWRENHPNYKKEYYKRNNEKMIEQARAWRKNNSEHFRKYMRKRQYSYYHAHKEEIQIWAKKYRVKNREKFNEMKRKCYSADPEKFLRQIRNWRKNNPEKFRFMCKIHNYRKKNAIGSHTYEEWIKMRDATNGWCKGYGRNPHFVGLERLTEDHIMPLKHGGFNFIENIQPLCRSCNARKNDKIPILVSA